MMEAYHMAAINFQLAQVPLFLFDGLPAACHVCIRLRPAGSAASECVFGREKFVVGAWPVACGYVPCRFGTAGTSRCC